MNKKTLVVLDNDRNAYIDTKQKVKVYTFLDGSINVLFHDKLKILLGVKDYLLRYLIIQLLMLIFMVVSQGPL